MTERELAIVDQVLEHENIVKIIEDFATNDRGYLQVYIVMEFCEGGDLNDYIIKNEPELKERFNLMTDMARGVLYLHSQNIVHRDLKPENVLLTNTGQRYICKITDFGLSRIKEHKKEMFSTQCGTLAYIAPEIIDGRPYSNSVDVFALGLLFFAVYKLTIIADGIDDKSLVPVKMSPNKRFDFMNSIIRNEQPTESTFIKTYFERSHEMGRLVFSMVRVKPELRIVMDKVLIGIVEAGVRLSVENQIRSLKDVKSVLESTVRKQEKVIKEQETKIKNLQNEKYQLPVSQAERNENRRILVTNSRKESVGRENLPRQNGRSSQEQTGVQAEHEVTKQHVSEHSASEQQGLAEQRVAPSCPPLLDNATPDMPPIPSDPPPQSGGYPGSVPYPTSGSYPQPYPVCPPYPVSPIPPQNPHVPPVAPIVPFPVLSNPQPNPAVPYPILPAGNLNHYSQ